MANDLRLERISQTATRLTGVSGSPRGDAPRIRLVRLVTRKFNELQGLRVVAAGVQMALFTYVLNHFNSGPLDGLLQLFGLVLVVTWSSWTAHWVPEYYFRRLGRVVPTRDPERWIRAAWLVLWILPITFGGPFRVVWLIWALCPAWLIMDGWPYRAHHVVTLAAAGYLAWLRIVGPNGFPETAWLVVGGIYLLSLVMVLTGFADHAVLRRCLQPALGSGASGSTAAGVLDL
jgi:hypothetical protein